MNIKHVAGLVVVAYAGWTGYRIFADKTSTFLPKLKYYALNPFATLPGSTSDADT